MKWWRRQRQRGSTLIEIVVASGVMALVITAIVAGLTLTLKTTAESEYRSHGVKRSQEAMEVFRRERTLRGWENFVDSFTSGTTYCLATLPAPLGSFTSGACTSGQSIVINSVAFYREALVTIDSTNPDDVKVTVALETTWNTGGDEQSVNLVQEFRQWE